LSDWWGFLLKGVGDKAVAIPKPALVLAMILTMRPTGLGHGQAIEA
jgi:hypothetical protein